MIKNYYLLGVTILYLLVYTNAQASSSIAYLNYHDGYWQVYVMDEEGKNQRQVTHSVGDKARHSWYPDGRHLMVNTNQGQLFKVNITSGKEDPIKTKLVGMRDAALSPDGRKIVFSLSTGDAKDANNLWLMDATGGNLKQITRKKWLQHEPTWGPAGQYVYFLSGDGKRDHDIWRINIKTKQQEQLTAGARYHFDIAVSHEGTLAYSNNRNGDYEIWTGIMGKAKQLTHHPAMEARPHWSADGQQIVFQSNRNGRVNIWRMTHDGQQKTQLTHNPFGARFALWQPKRQPAKDANP